MGKRILFLSFYFEPDLCAGSFRNSPLAAELASQGKHEGFEVDVITTLPNRYSTYSKEALEFEKRDNLSITRIKIPSHRSGIRDQINSFRTYYNKVRILTRNEKYDLVYASSSRLFSAYLGYTIAKSRHIPLYLDIRDIFVDTIKDVFPNPLVKAGVLPVMRFIEHQTFSYATQINLISGGFREYFRKYKSPNYSEFTNGIDPVFLNAKKERKNTDSEQKTVVYAGNIGEGQGLHRIIPQAAKELGTDFRFRIIGDGGARVKLINSLQGILNVELLPPVNRETLIQEYNNADFLFMHLNDFDAFRKVLPSKVFELGVFEKPLIAGVNGFARQFVEANIEGAILVKPCDGHDLALKLRDHKFGLPPDRSVFINSFRREVINQRMAASILSCL